jgi:hypothetical protein
MADACQRPMRATQEALGTTCQAQRLRERLLGARSALASKHNEKHNAKQIII